MSNIRELEIDGIKASDIPDVTKRNWVPFVAFLVLMASVAAFVVHVTRLVAEFAINVVPQ
jgi:hypothetical protein